MSHEVRLLKHLNHVGFEFKFFIVLLKRLIAGQIAGRVFLFQLLAIAFIFLIA